MEKQTIDKLKSFNEIFRRKTKTGKELFANLIEYKRFITEHWPSDMPDNGNWLSELESLIKNTSKYSNKETRVSASIILKSLKQDAIEAIHEINKKFVVYFERSK